MTIVDQDCLIFMFVGCFVLTYIIITSTVPRADYLPLRISKDKYTKVEEKLCKVY
jgi:hypothetical protein